MKTKGCLIAAGGALAVMAAAAAVLLPFVLRKGERVWKPVMEMRARGKEFEAFQEASRWKRPAAPTLTAEQLDRFLAVRRVLGGLEGESDGKLERLTEPGHKPGFSEVPDLMEGVSGVVLAEMKAYMDGRITPAEYRYVERIAYRTWLGALRKAGTDPLAWRHAAAELEKTAAAETGSVAARLRKLSAELRARRPAPPTGVPVEVHDLLFSRIAEIDELADQGGGRRMGQQF